ncbi:MAG: hypothetical protein ACREPY_18570, partial [Rhodanobacteraceae bacterium]
CNANGAPDPLITPHAAWLALDKTPDGRRAAYRASFERVISDDDMTDIRAHVQQQKALGDPRFQAHIAVMLDRNVAVRPRGRPRRTSPGPEAVKSQNLLPLEK